jgi:hypothetical protein
VKYILNVWENYNPVNFEKYMSVNAFRTQEILAKCCYNEKFNGKLLKLIIIYILLINIYIYIYILLLIEI